MSKEDFHPLDIILYHVGGYGSYGPINAIIESCFSSRCVVVAFEARDVDDERKTMEEYRAEGLRTIKIPYCVSNRESTQKFYINHCTLSSSLLPTSKRSAHKDPVYPWGKTWGEVTAVDHIIEVPCITLDSMVQAGVAPAPDLLSIDAQGSELLVLEGARNSIDQDIACIVTEIEFEEIYEGQCLFSDQKQFLNQFDFELMNILNQQFWHPGPAIGEGMLTVGEAVFFRNINKILEKYSAFTSFSSEAQKRTIYKLIKLAAISFCFNRLSYSAAITKVLYENFPDAMDTFFKDFKEFKPLKNLNDFYQSHQNDYLENNRFFLKFSANDFLVSSPDDSVKELPPPPKIETPKVKKKIIKQKPKPKPKPKPPVCKHKLPEERLHVKNIWQTLNYDPNCKSKGIAIYGAGKHTKWLLSEIKGLNGPQIKYILDDNENLSSFESKEAKHPSKLDTDEIGAILLSSDTFEEDLYKNCLKYFGKSIRVVSLYNYFKD